MREIILTLIVGVICVTALVKPRIGLLGYIWFALMRPDVLSWSANKPYSFALAIATLIGSLPHIFKIGIWFTNPVSRWLLILMVPITISAATAVNPDLSWTPWNMYIRIILTSLLIVIFFDTERELRKLMIVIAMSLGFLGLKFGVFGLLTGGSAQDIGDFGEANTMISDNNLLALALAMVVPLCWYARGMTSSKYLKLALFGMTLGSLAGVVMTHSRGGALCAGAGVLLIAKRSKHKFATVVVLAVLIAPAVYIVRDTYIARLSSITTDESKADGSILSRNEYRRAAFAMWQDYPWFGVGFGTYNYVNLVSNYLGHEDPHVVHNTYFQMLADSGLFAFLVYIGLLFGAMAWLQRSARAMASEHPGKEIYPYALQTCLVVFAIGSYFLSRVSYDLVYIVLMAVAAWRTVQIRGAFELPEMATA